MGLARAPEEIPAKRRPGERPEPPVAVERLVEEDVGAKDPAEVASPEGADRPDRGRRYRVRREREAERSAGERAQPPGVVHLAIDQDVRERVRIEVVDPNGRAGRQRAEADVAAVASQGPREASARDRPEPPVLVAGVVEEDLLVRQAREVAGPEGPAVIDRVTEAHGVPDLGEREARPRERPQEPVVAGGGVHQHLSRPLPLKSPIQKGRPSLIARPSRALEFPALLHCKAPPLRLPTHQLSSPG